MRDQDSCLGLPTSFLTEMPPSAASTSTPGVPLSVLRSADLAALPVHQPPAGAVPSTDAHDVAVRRAGALLGPTQVRGTPAPAVPHRPRHRLVRPARWARCARGGSHGEQSHALRVSHAVCSAGGMVTTNSHVSAMDSIPWASRQRCCICWNPEAKTRSCYGNPEPVASPRCPSEGIARGEGSRRPDRHRHCSFPQECEGCTPCQVIYYVHR